MNGSLDAQPSDTQGAVKLLTARPVTFVKGVAAIDDLPAADRPEVAFAGRSNVGKSSLLNALVGQKGLARTSNTPGRTQEINFFEAPAVAGAPGPYLADLPGYGYAAVQKTKVAAWQHLIRAYLRGRPTLKRVFLLIDARHGAKDNDVEIMKMLDDAAVSYQLVLTKIDKLAKPAQDAALAALAGVAARHPAAYPAILMTSAQKGWGLHDVQAAVAAILYETEKEYEEAGQSQGGADDAGGT